MDNDKITTKSRARREVEFGAHEHHPVQDVYAWEVPSSTEWSFQRLDPCFRPNVFVDISETLGQKIEAMKAYAGEIRDFPHPRSPDALEAIAKRWGTVAGFHDAEAFELVRSVRSRAGKP